jgi:26S proteasome regulatory subunit N13
MQSQQPDASLSTPTAEPSMEAVDAAIHALSPQQKRALLERVIRSPQLHQSLGSLTAALRDGGLPMVAQALSLDVQNGGLVRGGNVPLGGGDAVEAFVEGVGRTVKKEDEGKKEKNEGQADSMDMT